MRKTGKKIKVSVVIPCFNEEGNIAECIRRVPKMGSLTEILVVDDGSSDSTAQIVKKITAKKKNIKLISYKPNHGKGYAVKVGFKKATGDILIILDADMTVVPEDLPKFVNPLIKNQAGFANGTRFGGRMEAGAMKKLNYLGNKLMGAMFSLSINQKITDSLCGTKAIHKKNYVKFGGISENDPWSDFSLIFGAASLNLKILEVPVDYKRRVAGKSKMKILKHGYKLFKVWFEQYSIFRESRKNPAI